MNIDYGQILKNATARQEALELLELNLRELEMVRTHLAAAHVRLKDVWKAYKALDTEGGNLLGDDLQSILRLTDVHSAHIERAANFVKDLINEVNKFKES